MDIANLIQNIVILLAVLFTYHWQNKKIKTLETTIDSQKSILDSVQTFFNIFKVDEVDKYVNLKEANVKMEYENMSRELLNSTNDRINQITSSSIPKEKYLEFVNWVKIEFKKHIEIEGALISYVHPDTRMMVKTRLRNDEAKREFDELSKQYHSVYFEPVYSSIVYQLLGRSLRDITNKSRDGNTDSKKTD